MTLRGGGIRLASVVSAIASLGLAAPATGAESAGPAFVDELAGQLQPLRSVEPGDVADARAADVTIDSGRVLVDVYVDDDPARVATRLRALGMEVLATGTEPVAVVEGLLPLESISEAAELGRTDALQPVLAVGRDAGSQLSQSVAAHNLPGAIALAGVSGAGIDVGVISDSINQVSGGIDASQATGDLPADPSVVVLQDDALGGKIDEGRAMAEIIYDEAPGLSRILFNTGTLGATAKAAGIDALVAAGADVIADDIFYLSEPFFQDGQVSQAVDRARAAGVPYFASAGNRARQSYESTYRDAGGLHDFDPGAGDDTRSNFTGSTGVVPSDPANRRFIQIALQWDEPWGAAATDLDLRIVRADTGAVLASGTTDNVATGLPFESARFQNNTAGPIEVAVEIVRPPGPVRDPFMKWIEFDNFSPTPVPQFNTASDTINPDAAAARGALAVGAVNGTAPPYNVAETFSSRGPKTRLFDAAGVRLTTPEVRLKPELAAADAVSTSVPGFSAFSGTSASAPSAAGIATVLRSVNPGATVTEIYAQMTDPLNAIDCPASPFPDPSCGSGFVLADFAVAALDRTPIVPKAQAPPPKGKGGWFTQANVRLAWNLTDPESPIESTSGCDSITVRKQGKLKFTCSAVSGGGGGAATFRIKHDSKPPSRPKITGVASGKVGCKAKDKTSGLKSCKVRGFSTKPGKHVLKATATDKAGLKSKASLSYRVGG